jgi:hypothetical protein
MWTARCARKRFTAPPYPPHRIPLTSREIASRIAAKRVAAQLRGKSFARLILGFPAEPRPG